MITDRQKEILNRIVWEYINSARPVSSQLIGKRYHFGISPATIRIEMQQLTEAGYLCQLHTSSGRTPTDKGYRFFVDNLLKEGINDFESILEIKKLLQEEKKDILRLINRLAKFLAAVSSELATVYLLEKNFLWKEGWKEVLLKPEFNEKNLVYNFVSLLENLEKQIENLKICSFEDSFPCGLNSGVKIYIGKENPFSKARDFSIMFSQCRLPDGEKAIFTLLGPKRMNYNRNISLLNSLTKLLEGF